MEYRTDTTYELDDEDAVYATSHTNTVTLHGGMPHGFSVMFLPIQDHIEVLQKAADMLRAIRDDHRAEDES